MKIAFLMNSFYEIDTGGAEYQAYMIAKELTKDGHEVSFIFTKNKTKVCANKNSFKLYPIQKTKHNKLHLFKLIYFYQVYCKLKKVSPEIIYHRTFSSFLLIAYIYKIFHNEVKIILHMSHDNNVLKYKFRLKKQLIIKSIDDLFRYIGLSFTKNIIAQSYYQQQKLIENHNRKSIVIRNFCESEGKRKLGKKDNIILWIANVKPMKNPFAFINLANDLRKSKYRFLMIGKPPEGNYGKKFFEVIKHSNVEYLGKLSNKDVNNFLCKSKIFCCTSHGEGFSNTFLQAWIRKVPVVSLYVDPDNLIKKYGLGFHSLSYDHFKNDLLYLIDNPSELDIMAAKVKDFAEKNFLIHDNFKKFTNYLSGILS